MSQPLFSPNWIALHLVNIAIANASIIIAQIAVRMEINPLRHLAMSMAALSLTLVSQVLMGRIRFPGRALLAAASVPSAARRGAASAGTALVAAIRPPRAARSKKRFIMCSTFLSESSLLLARLAKAPTIQIADGGFPVCRHQ